VRGLPHWPFKKAEPQGPSPLTIIKAQTKHDLAVDENRSMNAEMATATGIAFDQQALDDEKILDLFDETKPLYHPLLMPLLPLVSRLNFLSNCSEADCRTFKIQCNIAIARLKNKARSSEDYMLLDNLKAYLHMRVNDSLKGFKIRVLTERNKTLTLKEEQLQKKRLGGLLG
jgi:hypothetical protein